jgi:hypothetical protein
VELYRAHHAWVVGPVPDGRLEDDALVVALALALGFDAVGASRPLFPTLYATFATSEAPSLRPLPHLGV